MSELYTSLQVSPRKKRGPPSDGGTSTTPKKLRTSTLSTTTRIITQSRSRVPQAELPDDLNRLLRFHNALQQALSHALATCAISPSSDSGRVPNVLNHISLRTYAGLTTSFGVEDLRRLCWLWEWDGETLPEEKPRSEQQSEDNPFLEESPSTSEWARGSMGFTVTLGSHYSKSERKRIPVYGIGIEVEMDMDKGMEGGMAAVARWTAAGEARREEFLRRLGKWVQLHKESKSIPPIPATQLPPLPANTKPSALTRTLASASPKSSAASQKFPIIPSSPSRSPTKKPQRDLELPFPVLHRTQSTTKVGRLLFPQTPSKHGSLRDAAPPETPQTPSTPSSSLASSVASTPVHQRGSDANSVPQTPTSSRRQALYERIRARSLSKSPTKSSHGDIASRTPMSRDQMLKFSQDEMRRRCLLERLPGIAESIWMLFSSSTPASSATTTPTRRRKAMPVTDVLAVIIKSSPVPISNAEANESLNMLMQLCPFFLKKVAISSKEWLEMPSSTQGNTANGSTPSVPTKSAALSSPVKGLSGAAQELVTRSPAVRHSQGGLREVREILRKEIELQD